MAIRGHQWQSEAIDETHLLREPEHRAGALALGEKGTHMELETKRKADERPAQRDMCLLLPQESHFDRLPCANELVELAKVSLGPLHGPLAVEEQAAVQQKLPVACAHLLRGGLELARQLSVVHLWGDARARRSEHLHAEGRGSPSWRASCRLCTSKARGAESGASGSAGASDGSEPMTKR